MDVTGTAYENTPEGAFAESRALHRYAAKIAGPCAVDYHDGLET